MPLENIRSHRRNGTLPRPVSYWRGRPRWNPDDIHNWDVDRRLPVDAWTMTDIAAYTGRRNPLTRSDAPQPDGHAGRTRWWRPSTITTWWSPIAAEQAVQAEQRQRSTTAVPEARWFGRDVAAATGMSYDTVRTYRRLGKLPSPDGTTGAEGRGRPWWRPETILSWDRPLNNRAPPRTTTPNPLRQRNVAPVRPQGRQYAGEANRPRRARTANHTTRWSYCDRPVAPQSAAVWGPSNGPVAGCEARRNACWTLRRWLGCRDD